MQHNAKRKLCTASRQQYGVVHDSIQVSHLYVVQADCLSAASWFIFTKLTDSYTEQKSTAVRCSFLLALCCANNV